MATPTLTQLRLCPLLLFAIPLIQTVTASPLPQEARRQP